MLLVATTFSVLSILQSIMTPIFIGTELEKERKHDNSTFPKIISKVFSLGEKTLSKIYKGIYCVVERLMVSIINVFFRILKSEKINCEKLYENKKKSIIVLLSILISVEILSGVYIIIGSILLPDIYKEIKDVILDNLSSNGITFKMIIDTISIGFSSFLQLLNIKLWVVKLTIFVFVSIFYVSTIFYGVTSIRQISENIKIPIINREFKFNVVSLTKRNFIIIVVFITIVYFLTNNIPHIDIISSISILLSLINIEVSLTSTIVIVAPIVVEKTTKYIINRINLKESHFFTKK